MVSVSLRSLVKALPGFRRRGSNSGSSGTSQRDHVTSPATSIKSLAEQSLISDRHPAFHQNDLVDVKTVRFYFNFERCRFEGDYLLEEFGLYLKESEFCDIFRRINAKILAPLHDMLDYSFDAFQEVRPDIETYLETLSRPCQVEWAFDTDIFDNGSSFEPQPFLEIAWVHVPRVVPSKPFKAAETSAFVPFKRTDPHRTAALFVPV